MGWFFWVFLLLVLGIFGTFMYLFVYLRIKDFFENIKEKRRSNPRFLPITQKEDLLIDFAKSHGAILSPIRIALETQFTIRDSEEILQSLLDKGKISFQIRKTGSIYWKLN